MDDKVRNAMVAGFDSFAGTVGEDAQTIKKAVENAFEANQPFMDKVSLLDAAFDDSPRFEELREFCFDLLMINFFSEDIQKLEEDYLESEEWEQIEEDTLDRGSELLNLLLYLRECEDAEIEPSLDDYLKEFLLVEEDEFQDEYNIYERVIANQILVESDFAEIAKVAKTINDGEEIKELFYPFVGFFNEINPSSDTKIAYKNNSLNPALDTAIYEIITNFNR